ncbi:MAG: ABC transporter permease [Candidatus Saccharibacteria bacterium]|nr:ABC transporter permease [Candidatus Saccharibacteria bacterium]
MIVSKAFWKIVLKNISSIITPTIILLLFGAISVSSTSSTSQFEAAEPSIVIFNHDENIGLTKNFIEYIDKHAEIKTDYEDDDRLKDALFYENVIAVVDIPENFHSDMTFNHNPEVKIRSSAGYSAELAKTMISRYLTTASAYAKTNISEQELISKIDAQMENSVEVSIDKAVDTSKYAKAERYFNFASYSILSCFITIICLIMSAFNRTQLRKRNLISSMDIKKMNRVLLKNCCLYSLAAWAFYFALSIFAIGADIMLTQYGLLFALNSLLFAGCATSIAYFISTFALDASAVNGVQIVIALGSSFLCGAFVPAQYLPDSVLAFAHVLPSYYYINANSKIAGLEAFDFDALLPILIEFAIVIGFSVLFIFLTNIVAKKRQKIA